MKNGQGNFVQLFEVKKMDKQYGYEFIKILNDWEGEEVNIKKKEKHDLDEAKMIFDHSELRLNGPTIDGYISPCVLQLQGKGEIKNNSDENQTLPYLNYEIPLDQTENVQINEKSLSFQTERGFYTIQKG